MVSRIIVAFTLLSTLACDGPKKTAILKPIDFRASEEMIEHYLDTNGLYYIKLYRYISDNNKCSYYIYLDSNAVSGVYKVAFFGNYHYSPLLKSEINSFRYFDVESQPNSYKTFDVDKIIQDSIRSNGLWISHEPWFYIKLKLPDVSFEKSGEYRLLAPGQPIEQFLIEIERDILNIEQKVSGKWILIDTQHFEES